MHERHGGVVEVFCMWHNLTKIVLCKTSVQEKKKVFYAVLQEMLFDKPIKENK